MLSTLESYGCFFRENCVWTAVTGMKIAFFAIFDPTCTHILAPKGPNMEFLKQNFNFQSIRKTEAKSLTIMSLYVWLTKVKTLKIITFRHFWSKMAKNVVLISFKCGISSYIGRKFPLRYFYNHYFLFLNVLTVCFYHVTYAFCESAFYSLLETGALSEV